VRRTPQEVNAGAQVASAASTPLGGWSNTLFYDGQPAIVNGPRLPLDANSSRRVFAMGINRYGVDAVVFQPYDLQPHVLTLQLDSGKEVAWRFPGPQLNYTVEIRFCTQALQVRRAALLSVGTLFETLLEPVLDFEAPIAAVSGGQRR
jgi:hypothetical protein